MMREGKIEPAVISDITRLSEIVEKSPRLTDEQKAQTVKNVLELLDDGNDPSMDAAARIEMPKGLYRTAAIQSAMHVADPDTINQYAHPTCALASLEVATYTRAPDVATGLVSEVLRTGKFVTTDGTVIQLDPMSLRPEHGSEFIDDVALNQHASPTQYRSYASQIFQTTAANIHWQTQTVNPDGQSVPRGTLRYELRYAPNATEDSPPTGYVVDYSGEKPKYWEAPGYSEVQMQNINELISNQLNYEFIPQNVAASEDHLKRFLGAMPADRMPITAAVDARYLSPNLAGEPNILAHDISIHASFDPTGPGGKNNWLVRMKNPWTGRSEYITISKLYEMTYDRPGFTGPLGQARQKMVPVRSEDFARARQQ
ncbi:MAG: hypothetical protein JST44_21975, partial [Cyanobacteria bacterium SZAS LIN-5]|nr:hypothetical protein [Cyanobacteria bacterium SZAS LIN-5]